MKKLRSEKLRADFSLPINEDKNITYLTFTPDKLF